METERYYHRTGAWPAIAADGWRDATGTYMTANEYSGVWISDSPLDLSEGASGAWLITIEMPPDVATLIDQEHEWIEEGKGYREWLVPAKLLNEFATVVHVDYSPDGS